MAKRSNKTSHVLNLLTNGSSEASVQETEQPALSQGKITVVDEADTNERVSGEILKGLEKELVKECEDGDRGEQVFCLKEKENEKKDVKSSKENFCFVNVMEELVRRQDLEKFLKEYQVCGCSRCRADICALALSRLPAKYIVTDSNSLPLLLSYYSGHYRVHILTQLIRACMEVREHPRHEGDMLSASREQTSQI